jgi:hypothetical protein
MHLLSRPWGGSRSVSVSSKCAAQQKINGTARSRTEIQSAKFFCWTPSGALALFERATSPGASAAGHFPPEAIGRYSTRVGAAHDMTAYNLGMAAIQQPAAWTSPRMPPGERLEAKRSGAAMLAERSRVGNASRCPSGVLRAPAARRGPFGRKRRKVLAIFPRSLPYPQRGLRGYRLMTPSSRRIS